MFLKWRKPCIGQIVKLKFRKKNQIGLILNLHNRVDLDFKLLEIDEILEDLVFQKEVLSINFLSNYACIPASLILKQFMSGFKENSKNW